MTELILRDWFEVNNYMREDYRLLVAAMAVRASSQAPQELQTLARTAFSPIPVHGARSFYKAALPQQRTAVAKAMLQQPQLTALVVALWAHAAAQQIGVLRQAAETAGAEFSADWDWQTSMRGFYEYDDIPLLYALAEKLGEHTSPQDADHLKLAALWLGPAVSNLDALAPTGDDETEEPAQDTPASENA